MTRQAVNGRNAEQYFLLSLRPPTVAPSSPAAVPRSWSSISFEPQILDPSLGLPPLNPVSLSACQVEISL